MAEKRVEANFKVLSGVVIAGKIYKKGDTFSGELPKSDRDILLSLKKVEEIQTQTPKLQNKDKK